MIEKHPSVDLSAKCGCGAVQVTVKGRILSMLMCACVECQKTTGAGHAAFAIAETEAVTVTGETRKFERPADSGATLTRFFCPVCATTLVAKSNRSPHIRLLPAGLFADQSWFSPGQVIFHRSHHHWDILPDDIPRHATYRED